jgi:hypothetical protein
MFTHGITSLWHERARLTEGQPNKKMRRRQG